MPAKKRTAAPAHSNVTVIYPHQLFSQSPALSRERAVILAEDPWFFRRHRFHAQKLVLHRASMRRYRDYLVAEGFTVDYLETAVLEKSADIYEKLAGNRVSGEEKAYCLRLIGRYKEGHATLAEPRDLLHSWVIRFGEPALLNQTFFAPYPVELTDLPEEITGRGRDVWKGRKASAVQNELRQN